jgi:spermidine synthase
VLVGTNDSAPFDVNAMNARLARPDYEPVVASLTEVGFTSLLDLLSTYSGNGADLKAWLSDAQINRDRNLRLQYIAGVGLNRYQSEGIFDQIVGYRRFPDSLFVADEAWKDQLRSMLSGWRNTP